MFKTIKKVLDKAFLGGEWSVAIKRANEDLYLVQNENHEEYWIADPFLYRRGSEYYLFCEKYLRRKDKGTIGVFEINEDLTLTDMGIAIEEKHHLSYPHMFEIGNELYMIPESSGAKTIDLYICKEFPLKWKKVKTLESGVYAVDSNTVRIGENRYLITYIYKNGVPYLAVYAFDDRSLTMSLICETVYNENIGRGAGNIFSEDGVVIRPTQNQRSKYGESILLNKITFDGESYCESMVSELKIDSIKTTGKKKYKRIHTYNKLDDLEVVDIRSEVYELFLIVKKIKRRFYNRGH